MKPYWKLFVALVCVSLASAASADTFGSGANAFSIDFVTISGDASSANGTNISQYSSSHNDYRTFTNPNNDYRMGTYEISNDQYAKFAAGLGVPVTGDPSSAYDEDPYFTGTNVPTNVVSWYEAAQFVNYLNTSTGHHAAYNFTGTQGTGDYTLATWTAAEADGGTNLYRHKDAIYYMPTEDEWVKAAYWNGTALQTYANASAGDLVSGEPDPTKWNYEPSAGNEPWNVGSGVEELNGTHDMMGNVWEWMESPWTSGDYGTASDRRLRGGSCSGSDSDLVSSYRTNYDPIDGSIFVGFRVASVPEPATLSLLAIGGLIFTRGRQARA